MAGTVMLAYYFEYTDTFAVNVQGFFCHDSAYRQPYPGPEHRSAVPPALLYSLAAGVPALVVSRPPARAPPRAPRPSPPSPGLPGRRPPPRGTSRASPSRSPWVRRELPSTSPVRHPAPLRRLQPAHGRGAGAVRGPGGWGSGSRGVGVRVGVGQALGCILSSCARWPGSQVGQGQGTQGWGVEGTGFP